MKKIIIIGIIFIFLVGALFLIATTVTNKQGKSGVEESVEDVIEKKPDFETKIEEKLKELDKAASAREFLESGVSQYTIESTLIDVKNVNVKGDTATCTAVTEKVVRNKDTGFEIKYRESYQTTLVKESGVWKISGIELLNKEKV